VQVAVVAVLSIGEVAVLVVVVKAQVVPQQAITAMRLLVQ
jgi:hypothetical protein